jgi:hypothetical protein
MRLLHRGGRWAAAAVALAGALALAACNAADTLLEATDPDIINPSDINTPEGADATRIGALGRLRTITGSAESTWLFGGLLADEWSTSSTFVQNDETDQRKIKEDNSSITGMFRDLNRARTSANQAIVALRTYRTTQTANIAEMYFVRGFAEMQIAQDFCTGIPLSDAAGETLNLGEPLSRTQVFERAIASLDTAVTMTTGLTDANGISVHRAARVAKARALVGLNRLDEAAALVPQPASAGTATPAQIPNNFSYDVTFSLTGGTNVIWGQGASARRYTVGDSMEGNARDLRVRNAIPFFSAADPRLPVTYTLATNGRDTIKSQDGFTFSRTTRLYGQLTPVPVVNGIDARLIEAEAKLAKDDYAGMIAILNALRDTARVLTPASTVSGQAFGVTSPRMALLLTPTSKSQAIDVFFREKAFWTFTRGQRLGDLRRLMKYYNRSQDQVFPVGTHYRGGEYGTDIALPVPTQERNNEKFRDMPRPLGDACNAG